MMSRASTAPVPAGVADTAERGIVQGGGPPSAVGSRPDNVKLADGFADSRSTAGTGDVPWPLAGLETSTCECAEDIARKDGQPCSSAPVVDTIVEFIRDAIGSGDSDGGRRALAKADAAAVQAGVDEGTLPDGNTTEAKAVRVAAAALGCTSESCVLSHPNFVSFARKKGVARRIEAEKSLRFKEAGPRNSTALLSNFNIDGTLQRWARVFPELYVYPFAMSDFERTGDELATVSPADIIEGHVDLDLGPGVGVVRRPASCLACVLNTDTSQGRGKHWVAMFTDARPRGNEPWTVEYYNSAGRPPFASIARWMESTKDRLAELRAKNPSKYGSGGVKSVAVTEVDHQLGDTECGLYALHYVRCRLEGKPIAFFEGEERIPDAVMTEFRKHCFRVTK